MFLFRHLFACLFVGIFALSPSAASSQPYAVQGAIFSSLDSICFSSSPARDFAFIYLKTTIGAKKYYENDSDSVQALMNRFENRFCEYFLKAAIAHRDSTEIPGPWKQYYTNEGASPLERILQGINAHINNDLWQALTHEFTLGELQALKESYYAFDRHLLQDYNDIYNYAFSTNRRVQRLHSFSLGIDKWYGALLLKKWRKRQLKIAGLFYTNTNKFHKKKKKVERKLMAVNRLIAFFF